MSTPGRPKGEYRSAQREGNPVSALSRRILGHTFGLLLAALVAWLIFRAYRQPDFLLDLANMRLC